MLMSTLGLMVYNLFFLTSVLFAFTLFKFITEELELYIQPLYNSCGTFVEKCYKSLMQYAVVMENSTSQKVIFLVVVHCSQILSQVLFN